MRRILIVTLLAASTWIPAVHSAETGSIHGVVTLRSKVRGNLVPTAAYSPRAVGRYQPPPTPEINYVLVYLKGAPFRGALPVMEREIVQEYEAFVPRVLAVTR